MADTQLNFCRFRWNNYQSRITKAFEDLFNDEAFMDVTLACEGKSLKAHRVILSACSSYFTELLKSTPCKHPVIVLQNVAFRDLHALVGFIYHGEVTVHQSSLSSFLKTAETLGISGFTLQVDQIDSNKDVHFTGSNIDKSLHHTSGFGNGLQTSDLADTSQKQEVEGFRSLQSTIKIDYQRQIQQQFDQTDRDEHVQFTGSNNDESLDRTSGFGSGLQTSDLADNTSQKQDDGGFGSLQSAIDAIIDYQIQQSPMKESDRCSEMIVQTQQELQRIEENLIDDLSQMEFVKSEPASPRLDQLSDEHESCLSSNHIIKEVHTNLDSAHNRDHDCRQYNYLIQPTPRKSLNDDVELRWLQSSDITSLIYVHKEQDQSLSSTFCKLCQNSYSAARFLRRHFIDCHLYKQQALVCDQCGKSYKSKGSLTTHKSLYHRKNRGRYKKNKY